MSQTTKDVINVAAPGISYFTPAQNPPAGTALNPQPDGRPIPKLFQPIKIRGVEFHNRIFLSPLCQYSADDGHLTFWHKAHLGGIFTRGPGLSFVESTTVLPEGRITPEDAGLWKDSQIPPLKEIADFAHSQGQKIGIQLAHAGRKASTVAPWLDGLLATERAGGFPSDVWGPSPIPFDSNSAPVRELSIDGIKRVVAAFADSAKRAVAAGVDVIEIHGAHGYLLNEFLSLTTNHRTDEYGGSFKNRVRLTLEVIDAIRAVIPQDMPLFLRVSATEWLEESLPNEPSWRLEDTVKLAHLVIPYGVDLLDVSTGGNHPLQKFGPLTAGYQAPFAEAVKKSVGDSLLVGAVGAIASGLVAQNILDANQVDVVFVGREFQRNPSAVWTFADELGVSIHIANQIKWGIQG